MLKICLLLFVAITKECWSQDDDEGPYRGKLIGRLNSYHHQVSGEVYAVDEWTLLLINFNYDGTGDDTFFWAGDSGRPGPQGFIVPDQNGKTNILERYYNDEVRLTLPEGKRVSRVKWLAVYDIGSQNTFGDVFVPDDFEAPAPHTASPLAGNGVTSQPVQFLDDNTVLIPELRYDGNGHEVYFWAGVGPQPSARGFKVPDEYGYLEPLGAYNGTDVRLRLTGERGLRGVQWLALWDAAGGGAGGGGGGAALAWLAVPEALRLPPAAARPLEHATRLPNCRQLHAQYQVAWEVFGNQVTFELAGQIGEDEYMAFGISGSPDGSSMLGADVAVAAYSRREQRAIVLDYNITDRAACVHVLGRWRGVCGDVRLGGLDDNQVFSASRRDGLTLVTYRRNLKPVEAMDLEWSLERPTFVVWAVGRLEPTGEPGFHRLYPRRSLSLELAAKTPYDDCFPFTTASGWAPKPWEAAELFDPALRVFNFALGPSGGRRGLGGREPLGGRAPAALAWYVNGQLAPALQLRRGLTYSFRVRGGRDPHSASEYHPLIVTAEPVGGLERLDEAAQRAAKVLAGVLYTRRGRLAPAAAGPLCIARRRRGADARRDEDYATFRAFNRSLQWECGPEPPAQLQLTPNSTWPDVVYYHSFTHTGMGGLIYVVDRHRRTVGRRSAAPAAAAPLLPLLLLLPPLLLLPH